jgi:carbonic anhydrase/SulP family sulfate permease
VVLLGVLANDAFRRLGGPWPVGPAHLVQVPIGDALSGYLEFLQAPDFSQWSNPAIYLAAVTIAAVASLETLLNLDAVNSSTRTGATRPRAASCWPRGPGTS